MYRVCSFFIASWSSFPIGVADSWLRVFGRALPPRDGTRRSLLMSGVSGFSIRGSGSSGSMVSQMLRATALVLKSLSHWSQSFGPLRKDVFVDFVKNTILRVFFLFSW